MAFEYQIVDKIIQDKGRTKKSLIPILQAIQHHYQYLPEEALKRVEEATDITASEIIGVASFYSQFRLKPVGETYDQGLCGHCLPCKRGHVGL